MRLLLYPMLLLAAMPAYARFCDGEHQRPSPPAGDDCTFTRSVFADPGGLVVGHYSKLDLTSIPLTGAVCVDIDVSALTGQTAHSVTLLEMGFSRRAASMTESPGGILALSAITDPYSRPTFGWTWFDGSPDISTLDSPVTWLSSSTVAAPMPTSPSVSVEIRPDPDWCHLRILLKNDTHRWIDTAYQVSQGRNCDTAVLRAGVMAGASEDGMAASFNFTSPWIIEAGNAEQ
jgi:hypothetical protein